MKCWVCVDAVNEVLTRNDGQSDCERSSEWARAKYISTVTATLWTTTQHMWLWLWMWLTVSVSVCMESIHIFEANKRISADLCYRAVHSWFGLSSCAEFYPVRFSFCSQFVFFFILFRIFVLLFWFCHNTNSQLIISCNCNVYDIFFFLLAVVVFVVVRILTYMHMHRLQQTHIHTPIQSFAHDTMYVAI